MDHARERLDRLERMIPGSGDDGPTAADLLLWGDPIALGWVAALMDPATTPERARECARRLHARSRPTPALLAYLAARYPASSPILPA